VRAILSNVGCRDLLDHNRLKGLIVAESRFRTHRRPAVDLRMQSEHLPAFPAAVDRTQQLLAAFRAMDGHSPLLS
jgi:hypothetical protein